MATAKQRAWRKRFAELYGGKKKSGSKRKAYKAAPRGGHMAKKKKYSKKSSGLPIKRILTMVSAGVGASALIRKFAPNIDSKLAAAAGGYFTGGLMGAGAGYAGQAILEGAIDLANLGGSAQSANGGIPLNG